MTKNVFMQEAGSEGSAGGTTEKRKRAPKTNLLDIQRGRLPLALVAAVRFVEPAEVSNNDLAKKYGTSVGKIFDIRKGRNFSYIDSAFKPSSEDLKAAEVWAKGAAQHGGDEAAIMAAVDKLGVASEDEAKSQAAKISAARSKGPRQPKAKSAEGSDAPTGDAKSLLQ